MEKAGQALLDAPLASANNVGPLLAKLAQPEAHDQASVIMKDLTTGLGLERAWQDAPFFFVRPTGFDSCPVRPSCQSCW